MIVVMWFISESWDIPVQFHLAVQHKYSARYTQADAYIQAENARQMRIFSLNICISSLLEPIWTHLMQNSGKKSDIFSGGISCVVNLFSPYLKLVSLFIYFITII